MPKEGNITERRPHRQLVASALKSNCNVPILKPFKCELASPGIALTEKLRNERNVQTLNPRMLSGRLERLTLSPVLDKKGGSPLIRNEYNAQKKISIDDVENCESIHLNEGDRFALGSCQQMPEIHLKNLSDRRNSGTKCPHQEEERKKSSLKSRLLEAKTQEAELGRRLLPQETLSDKRKIPADVMAQRLAGNKQEQDSMTQGAENLSLSKKYQSPVLYEMQRQRRGAAGDQEDKRASRLEETIQDESDQASLSLTYRGGLNELSVSVLNSYSTSGSKESSEKRKSTSVDRSCSFILRKEKHLRRSLGKNLSASNSLNNSENNGICNQRNSMKQPTATEETQKDTGDVIDLKESKKEEIDEDKTQYIPAYQGLFPSNNTTIIQPIFKEFSKNESKFQVIDEKEEAVPHEERNSHSGGCSLSESNKKGNVLFLILFRRYITRYFYRKNSVN